MINTNNTNANGARALGCARGSDPCPPPPPQAARHRACVCLPRSLTIGQEPDADSRTLPHAIGGCFPKHGIAAAPLTPQIKPGSPNAQPEVRPTSRKPGLSLGASDKTQRPSSSLFMFGCCMCVCCFLFASGGL